MRGMTPEERAVIDVALTGWDGQCLTDVDMSAMADAVASLVMSRAERAAAQASRSAGEKCGHDQTVMWSGMNWVHPMDMGVCDRPPVSGHYFAREGSFWVCTHGCGVVLPYPTVAVFNPGPCVPLGAPHAQS